MIKVYSVLACKQNYTENTEKKHEEESKQGSDWIDCFSPALRGDIAIVDFVNQIYNRLLPTLLSEMGICRFCKSDLQRFFANTPKRNAQFVDFVDLSKLNLQPLLADTPKRNWHL